MQDKVLENLEAKLKASRIENGKILEKIETKYKNEYSVFLDNFENNKFKEMVGAYFAFYKLDAVNMKNNLQDKIIFDRAVKKVTEHLVLSNKNKEILAEKVSLLEKTKFNFNDIFLKQTNIKGDLNYPILESFLSSGLLNNSDLLEINLSFKKNNSIKDSIYSLQKNKKELLEKAFFSVNYNPSDNTKTFENDFSKEIKTMPVFSSFPIVSFIGYTYNRLDFLKLKESRIDALKRSLKIALLRLAKLRKSGIDIDEIMKRIDSISDLDSIISLILEFLDKIRENKTLSDDYITSLDLNESQSFLDKSDKNANKILSLENSSIKVNELLENGEKVLEKQSLASILDDSVDLIGNEFKKRKIINAGILTGDTNSLEEDEEIDLEEILIRSEDEFKKLEIEKKNMFLKAEFENIDEINEKMLYLMKKLQKLKVLLGLNEEEFEDDGNVSEITKIT